MARTLVQTMPPMITIRIRRRGATCCQLKWFAPVWSRFLAIRSSAVLGHDSLRVYRDAAPDVAVLHKTRGSAVRIRVNGRARAPWTAAVFGDAGLDRASKAREEKHCRTEEPPGIAAGVPGYPFPDAEAASRWTARS